MTATGHPKVAVIDIGKTNGKLALVDTATRSEAAVLTRPNTVIAEPPYPHYDIDGLWQFVIEGLAELQNRHGVDAISVATHGASGVLLDTDGGLACPVLDYEHTGPDDLAVTYNALRPPFSETGSPRLPTGLNLGAQFHWLLETQTGLDSRTAKFATYPQLWSGRLSGEVRSDPSSLGAHTDLWAPHRESFSSLVDTLGIRARMAQVAPPDTRLGPVLPEIARATGLSPDTPVHCGIHDSNASLLPHLLEREPPFAVVSTGTWVISMAIGGTPTTLAPERDTLINVDALGRPVPSARFMGGREHDLLRVETAEPDEADIARVLSGGLFLMPSVERTSGPFQGAVGGWSVPDASPAEKSVALSCYLALMTAECLALIGADGPILVEGPFGRNGLFLQMLGAATGRDALVSGGATGTAIGAAMLASGKPRGVARPRPASDAPRHDGLAAYADRWRAAVYAAQAT